MTALGRCSPARRPYSAPSSLRFIARLLIYYYHPGYQLISPQNIICYTHAC